MTLTAFAASDRLLSTLRAGSLQRLSAMKFRSGDADIKPYVQLYPTDENGLQRLPLRRIVYGPTLRQDETMVETIGLLLERYGYGGVPVEPCGIPYRL